ncbi:hypothetical protein SASPL_141759 [Salvia splendens]|uniref:Uncharacterized protein n=1 Tax=Salvia splendens TaxID=180675 RepID=A0A8X8Z8F7_SALSN|nr:hypothetical protein SASPL_141759 [Salvia splendens]
MTIINVAWLLCLGFIVYRRLASSFFCCYLVWLLIFLAINAYPINIYHSNKMGNMITRGSVIHTKYFYCSAIMVPLTSVFMVLPLPNIPFFWLSFRAYSHWRASQGSEKLMHLVTDASYRPNPSDQTSKTEDSSTQDKNSENSMTSIFVFQPSEELEKLIQKKDSDNGLSDCAISKICQKHYLIAADVKRYRDSV